MSDYKKKLKNTINEFDKIIINKEIKNYFYISNIFFVRNHPVFDKKYLFFKKNKLFLMIKILFKFLSKRINSLRYGFKKSLSFSNNYQKYDYLFISHKFDNKTNFIDNDYIYGDLFSYLIKEKKKICVIYFNQTSINIKKLIKPNFNNQNIDVILFNNKTNFINDFPMLGILVILFFEIIYKKKHFSSAIFYFLIFSIFEEETLLNIRISKFIEKLTIKNISKIFITFEGHAYERNIIRSFKKKYSLNQKIYAYLHTSIYQSNHGIYQAKYPMEIVPDKYLFSGKIAFNEFINNCQNINKSSLYVIGSKRFTEKKSNNYPIQNYKNFLLLPDGTEHETNIYYDTAIELASKFKEYNFFIKFHPSQNSLIMKSVYKNLIIIEDSLKSFLENNKVGFAIYSSSSSILSAILSNIYPIFYQYDQNINTNPLYMLWNEKYNLKRLDDLEKIINEKEYKNYSVFIQNQCHKYFERLNYQLILKV